MTTKDIYEILTKADLINFYELSDDFIKEKETFPGSGYKGVIMEESKWMAFTVAEKKTFKERTIVKEFGFKEDALKVFLIQKLRDIITLQHKPQLYKKYGVNLPNFTLKELNKILQEIPENYYCYEPIKKSSSYQLLEKDNSFAYQYICSDGEEMGYNEVLFTLPIWQVLSSFFTAIYTLFMIKKLLPEHMQSKFVEKDYFFTTIW